MVNGKANSMANDPVERNGSKSRFGFRNFLIYLVTTVAFSSVIGYLFSMAFVSPGEFPIWLQHAYESSALLGGGLLALLFVEGVVLDQNIYDDAEITVYLAAFTALTLFPLPIIGDRIASPFINYWQYDLSLAGGLALLAAVEVAVGITIVVVLERYTEII